MNPPTLTSTSGLTCGSAVLPLDRELQADRLRLPKGSVARELLENPWKFDFFQAVLVLHQIGQGKKATIGRFSLPSEEPMRFAVPDSLAFPGSTIQSVVWEFDTQRPTICVNFMGLTGPSGVLPRSYTERLQQIDLTVRHTNRHALRDWLDNFNHRLLSLFFQGWAKYRFPVSLQQAGIESAGRHARPALIRVALASVAGLDPHTASQQRSASEQPAALDRDEWLGLAGVLAQRPMNVSNLQATLQRCLGVDIRIRQFQGEWLGLESESQTSLGITNSVLGESALVGERIWSRDQKILIEVGPLSPAEFEEFLPPTESSDGAGYRRLVELVRVTVGPALNFDIRPRLRVDTDLGVTLTAEDSCQRLGIDSWLETPSASIADDAVFAGTGPCVA